MAYYQRAISNVPAGNVSTMAIVATALLAYVALKWVVYSAYLVQPDAVWLNSLTTEDGLIEYLQAAGYAVAGILAVLAMRTRGFSLLALMFAIGCVVLVGEEISWGQRIFSYNVPAVEALNNQAEFNLHNMTFLTGHGFRAATDLESFLVAFTTSTNFFQMAFALFFLAIPGFCFVFGVPRWLARVGYVVPPVAFLAGIWTAIAVSFGFVFNSVDAAHTQMLIEMRELVFAAAFAGYGFVLLRSERPNVS